MQRRGYATTEFWAALAVGLGSLAASLTDVLPPRWAALAASIASGAYAISRGLAKVTAPLPAPQAPPVVQAPPLEAPPPAPVP